MNTAVILAGGTGTRFGENIPKQYIEVGGKPVIAYCLEIFEKHPLIDCIQVVAEELWHKYIIEYINSDKFKGFSKPGKTRQLSVYHALCDVQKYSDESGCVIIHDAARPMVSATMITECLEALREHDGALPVLPMKDTVYQSDDGKCISNLIERRTLYAGQAPEAFRLAVYKAANDALMPNKILSISGSTEPAVMAGMDVALISGDENNFKITTRADMEHFKEILLER